MVVAGRSRKDFRGRLLHAYLPGRSAYRRGRVYAGAGAVTGDQTASPRPPCRGTASPHGPQTQAHDGFIYRHAAHTATERLPEGSPGDGLALVPAVGRGSETAFIGVVAERLCG